MQHKHHKLMPEIMLGIVIGLILISIVVSLFEGAAGDNPTNTLEEEALEISEEPEVIIDPISELCYDQDKGLNYLEKGVVTLYNGTKYTDYCINDSDLVEYHCVNDDPKNFTFSCPEGCFNSSCVVDSSSDCVITNIRFERVDAKVNANVLIEITSHNGRPVFMAGTDSEFDGLTAISHKKNGLNFVLKVDKVFDAIEASSVLNNLEKIYLIQDGDVYCKWED